MTDERPRHIDLFSGIGGFSVAAEAAGFETVAFSEIASYPSRVLKELWPHVQNFGSIDQFPTYWFRRVDLLTGGFPCQPFSFAGKRRGARDDRALWPKMFRIIAETRPTWVLGENVPGIISLELDRVLSDLESLGYACRPFTVPACAVGAKHRRDRVWILCADTSWQSGTESERQHERPKDNRRSGDDGLDAGSALAFTNGVKQRQDAMQNGCCVGLGRKEQTEWSEGSGEASGCRGVLADRGSLWPSEPAVGRVAHGIPDRSHRIKALGNAIVPQVAEVFLKAIYQQLRP